MTALLEVEDLCKRFPVGGGPGAMATAVSRIRGRSLHRPELHAVERVSFAIGRGETVGLVGESGCGKSTLVRLLTRLLDPTSGSIRFDGADIGRVPAHAFVARPERAAIQMVFQDAGESLNPRYTAFDAIADPLRRLRAPGSAAALRRRVEELADMTGLPGALLGRFPHQLSGGQKARVGIARAIGVEPRLLILDEPTSALDVSVQVVILQLLATLKERLGMSYLFVSHDLNVVRMLCDRVLVMYLGRVVESGPAEQVFESPGHPYTKALLSAVPSPDPAVRQARTRLGGEPRSPIDPDPRICRFHGRCPKGIELCTQVMPELVAHPGERWLACHFPEPMRRPLDGLPVPPLRTGAQQ